MIARLVVLVLALLALPAGVARSDHVADQEAVVVNVVDGDTIDVQLADGSIHRVRLIGIDTPETRHPTRGVECFGPEASARNTELVLGATVYLERDVSDTDRFGRLVRHVWLGEDLVTAWLLAEGYARAYPFRPDTSRAEELAAIEAEAWAAGLGLWGACGEPTTLSDLDEPVTDPAGSVPQTPAPTVAPTPTPVATLPIGSRTGRPLRYDPNGPDRDCADFSTWAEAQDFYEAAGGPERDPHRLDADRDGIACESLAGAPQTETVPIPTPSPQTEAAPTPVPSSPPPSCCRICTTGKACGNTCIARDRNCNVGPGCACNAADYPELLATFPRLADDELPVLATLLDGGDDVVCQEDEAA